MATSAGAAPTCGSSKRRSPRKGCHVAKQQPPAAGQPAPPAGPTRSWPPVAERAPLGKSIKRLARPDQAIGKAKYTYDILRPGLLYGEILWSPHARPRARG